MKYEQPQTEDGLVVTLNQMGYMLSKVDSYISEFIEFSSLVNKPVLDIGAAYGIATIPALNAGAYVIANDLDYKHLEILYHQTSLEARKRLTLKPGRVPNETSFPVESLGAILASRVLNFIRPEELVESLKLIFDWLTPGGKFFFTSGTPFMGTFSSFLPTYTKYKAEGHPWPGFIEDVANNSGIRSRDLPSFIHVLDQETAVKICEEAGFYIEKTSYIAALPEHPQDMKNDGREHVGLIAVKKV